MNSIFLSRPPVCRQRLLNSTRPPSETMTCQLIYTHCSISTITETTSDTGSMHGRRRTIDLRPAYVRHPLTYVRPLCGRRLMWSKMRRIFANCDCECKIVGPFLSFFCPQFSSGSNYSSQNAGTIANKFQLHTYFRFR